MADQGSENDEQRLKRLIVGGWNHHSRYVEYFKNGTYVIHPRRGDDEPGKWQITGGMLIHTADNGQVSSNKIVSLDGSELALDFGSDSSTLYLTRSNDEPRGQMADVPHKTIDIPFLNCTLAYTSHSADWAVYLGGEASGKGAYFSNAFEGRGGGVYSGELDYVIEAQGGSKWKVTLNWGNVQSVQEMIFWTSAGDAGASGLKAQGNIYDASGKPMWPGGEKPMDIRIVRGKHFENDAGTQVLQQKKAEPQSPKPQEPVIKLESNVRGF